MEVLLGHMHSTQLSLNQIQWNLGKASSRLPVSHFRGASWGLGAFGFQPGFLDPKSLLPWTAISGLNIRTALETTL